MKNNGDYIYSKDTEVLQISYAQYTQLVRQDEEARNLKQVGILTFSKLRDLLASLERENKEEKQATPAAKTKATPQPASPQEKHEPTPPPPPAEESAPAHEEQPVPSPEEQPAPVEQKQKKATPKAKIPPIKKEIALHFSKKDGSGRLFDVFKEYYASLNEVCGGMMRVTMKDGICSLWNYDEWEEFAFVDLFDNHLRVAISPKYANALKSFKQCDVPRLLARRRKLIGVLVDGMDEGLLGVLELAFNEAGTEAK